MQEKLDDLIQDAESLQASCEERGLEETAGTLADVIETLKGLYFESEAPLVLDCGEIEEN